MDSWGQGRGDAQGCGPIRSYENGCAEGTLDCDGLTPPSPLGLYALGTLRRRQAVALQGASRIFMRGGEPQDHEVFAHGRKGMAFSQQKKMLKSWERTQ